MSQKHSEQYKIIGQAIKKAREAKKITREQLAEIIDCSARHIQSIENEGFATQYFQVPLSK